MAATNNQSKSISKEDLSAEIDSRIDTLDFSQTKRGPNCNGCFTLVFGTVCGHAYVVHERCKPKGLVCAGSKPLTVYWDHVTLALGEANCQYCRKIRKYLEDHPESHKKLYARQFTPKMMVAKMRMEDSKEEWQRECVEQGLPVAGLTRGQLDALAAEKVIKEKDEDPKASPSRAEDSSSSEWILPEFCDFVDDHPRMLHDPKLENEWMERGKCLLEKVGSVSRAENDAESAQSPIDDSLPALVFRSPFLSKAPTNKTHVKPEE